MISFALANLEKIYQYKESRFPENKAFIYMN